MSELLRAAEAMIARLAEIRAVHGMPYTGPNWGEPLAALRTAVDAAKAAGDGGEIIDWLVKSEQGPFYIKGYGWAQPYEFRTACRAAMAAEGQGEGK